MTKNTISWREAGVFAFLALLVAIALCSCYGGPRLPLAPGTGEPGAGASPLGWVAFWGSIIGGIGFLASIAYGVLVKDWLNAGRFALVALAIIIGGAALAWINLHIGLILSVLAILLVLGLLAYGYLHRNMLQRKAGIILKTGK